jgi:DNA mismatch endonuclease (patch repair protein)
MTDRVDRATRSRIMSRIRGRDTRIELLVRRRLWRLSIRGYRCHRSDVLGRPDIAWPGLRLAIFVDSAWWHGHPSRWIPGRLPTAWDDKIRRNKARDVVVTHGLETEGWRVLRVWDFEIERDLDAVVSRIRDAVTTARSVNRPRRRSNTSPSFPAVDSGVRHVAGA